MKSLLLLILVIPLMAQQADSAAPPAGPPPHGPMPEPKNLQVLRVSHDQLMPIMRTFTASLGVRCDFCHVQGNFASDDKPEKQTARMMIKMTADINSKFADNQIHVACFTCHRGSTEPLLNAPAGHEEHPGGPPPPPPPPPQ